MEESSPGVKVTVFLRQDEQGLMEKGKEVKAGREWAVWRYSKKELISSWWEVRMGGDRERGQGRRREKS